MPKGMTIAKAISCAIKVQQGQKCSVSETAAALDTLFWAHKKGYLKAYQPRNVPKDTKKMYKRTKRYV